jgi:hypothetical protein
LLRAAIGPHFRVWLVSNGLSCHTKKQVVLKVHHARNGVPKGLVMTHDQIATRLQYPDELIGDTEFLFV